MGLPVIFLPNMLKNRFCPLINFFLYFSLLLDNFQDQMKRELAYREEMVQQLQIVRFFST